MEKFNMVIKGGKVYPLSRICDIGINDGKITVLREDLCDYEADELIDASGCIVCPSFVDANIHLDTVLTADDQDDTDVLSAFVQRQKMDEITFGGWSQSDIEQEMIDRASEVIEVAIANGTTAIKANVSISTAKGRASIDALQKLKEKYKDYISIYSIIYYNSKFEKEWLQAQNEKKIDFIGCCPDIIFDETTQRYIYNTDYKKIIDEMLDKATTYNLPIDFHCCQYDMPNTEAFEYIINKTYKNSLQGKVTCGNVNGLNSRQISEIDAARIIAKCAKAEVNITTMPTNDLYLMDISRRGGTRVEQLQQAGVKISVASGNIRDIFNPFGRADLLEEALTAAQMYKMGTSKQLDDLFRMITYYPAASLLLKDYGILPGCQADLVIMDAESVAEAIISQAERKYVIKKGKVVAKERKLVKM